MSKEEVSAVMVSEVNGKILVHTINPKCPMVRVLKLKLTKEEAEELEGQLSAALNILEGL